MSRLGERHEEEDRDGGEGLARAGPDEVDGSLDRLAESGAHRQIKELARRLVERVAERAVARLEEDRREERPTRQDAQARERDQAGEDRECPIDAEPPHQGIHAEAEGRDRVLTAPSAS